MIIALGVQVCTSPLGMNNKKCLFGDSTVFVEFMSRYFRWLQRKFIFDRPEKRPS